MEPATSDKKSLAVRLVEGDETVVRDIIVTFGPSVITALERYFGDWRINMTDIFGEAVAKLWDVRLSFDSERNIGPYLYVICKNFATEARQQLQNERVQYFPDVSVLLRGARIREPDGSIGKSDANKAAMGQLFSLLQKLPEWKRIIALNESYDEAVPLLQKVKHKMSRRTFNVNRHRILKHLRAKMQGFGFRGPSLA